MVVSGKPMLFVSWWYIFYSIGFSYQVLTDAFLPPVYHVSTIVMDIKMQDLFCFGYKGSRKAT